MTHSMQSTTFDAKRYTFNATIEELILLEEALWQRQQIHDSIATKVQHQDHDKAIRHAHKSIDFEELAQMVTDLINSRQKEVIVNADISN